MTATPNRKTLRAEATREIKDELRVQREMEWRNLFVKKRHNDFNGKKCGKYCEHCRVEKKGKFSAV